MNYKTLGTYYKSLYIIYKIGKKTPETPAVKALFRTVVNLKDN